jgi:hypothetical protein
MAATIKIKNSSTASAVPTSSDLVQGELAVNVTDKRIFTENASGTVVELGTNPSTLTVTAGATIQGLTVGKGAGSVSTNTAVGASALAANTTGGGNQAFGVSAGAALTTGNNNTALGRLALATATTPDQNTAVGYASLYLTTTGQYNTSVGGGALQNNTTASNNTAVGYQAGYTNTTGTQNTFIGYQAGYLTTSSYNCFVGLHAGYSTTGTLNNFFGYGAGTSITSGAKNTVVGSYSGNQGGLDIRTSNNLVVLSDGDGQLLFLGYGTATTGRYVINDGGYFYCATDNVMGLGASSKRWTTVYATTGTINTSDATQKQDIAELDDAEKRVATSIKSLIKKYRFKDAVAEKGDAARIHIGAVAQEVAAAFAAEGLDASRYALFCSDTWYEVDGKPAQDLRNPYTAETPNAVKVTRLGLRYEELLAFVIAAL